MFSCWIWIFKHFTRTKRMRVSYTKLNIETFKNCVTSDYGLVNIRGNARRRASAHELCVVVTMLTYNTLVSAVIVRSSKTVDLTEATRSFGFISIFLAQYPNFLFQIFMFTVNVARSILKRFLWWVQKHRKNSLYFSTYLCDVSTRERPHIDNVSIQIIFLWNKQSYTYYFFSIKQ